MFFVKEMERSITLHPSFVGTNIKPYLKQEVQRDVEGKVEDSHLIICVLDDYTFSEGRVLPGGGKVEYTAHFKALVWKPFKMEVVSLSLHSAQPRLNPRRWMVYAAMLPTQASSSM